MAYASGKLVDYQGDRRTTMVALRVLAGCMAIAALALAGLCAPTTLASSRYDRSDPPAGAMIGPGSFVLRAWFSEELASSSTITVADDAGQQVDLGDGRVDLDDADRKVMLVSVPELPTGVYAVNWTTVSAEDGATARGAFAFGVGLVPERAFPAVNAPAGGWLEVGYWRDGGLMTTEPFTVRGPWRIRWRLGDGTQPIYMMLLEGDRELHTYTDHLGTTRGIIQEEQGGTFRLMFHNTVPYEVIVEDRAGP